MNLIIPGVWVDTHQGEAVVLAIEPHHHRLGPPAHITSDDGTCQCACESDACADAQLVIYRYEARRGASGEGPLIWVLSSDLSHRITFLRGADLVSACVQALTGPYGEGPRIPPYPPAVIPAGPTSKVRATEDEVFDLERRVSDMTWNIMPDSRQYDVRDAAVAQLFSDWFAWEKNNLSNRLQEVGWTLEEYHDATMLDMARFYEELTGEGSAISV